MKSCFTLHKPLLSNRTPPLRGLCTGRTNASGLELPTASPSTALKLPGCPRFRRRPSNSATKNPMNGGVSWSRIYRDPTVRRQSGSASPARGWGCCTRIGPSYAWNRYPTSQHQYHHRQQKSCFERILRRRSLWPGSIWTPYSSI